jgi:SRSO17 transposase
VPGRRPSHLRFAARSRPDRRELYLPAAWAEDEERRLLRHVPDEVTFATKPQLAAAMLHGARQLGLPARWFTGDEVYGSLELRRTARTLGFD